MGTDGNDRTDSSDDPSDFDEFVRSAAEIGLGTAILALRQVNIQRRALVERVPAAAPAVDTALGCVEELAAPVSRVIGAAVIAVGGAVPGTPGTRLTRIGAVLADGGPELLRLSGLTKRN